MSSTAASGVAVVPVGLTSTTSSTTATTTSTTTTTSSNSTGGGGGGSSITVMKVTSSRKAVETSGDSVIVASGETDSTTALATIDDLYKYYGILADAKADAGKHVDIYLKIISGTKAGIKEKQLASQFITRFFKYFPKEMPIAIDAIFDLCEDDDVTIRKSAIKDLATLCKECPVEHLNRIADILTQLLQTNDQQEFIQVQSSLFTVFKQNPKSTLNEIFNQINTAELEEVRKRAIKFLVAKVPPFVEQSTGSTKELEDLIVKDVKQVLIDVDAEEFILFIRLLTSLPSMNTLTGRQDLVNIIMAQSEIDKPFDTNDVERLMVLLSCIQQAIPLFSKNVQSTKFVNHYLDNVLNVFHKLNDETIKFEILKSFAELCIHYNGQSTTSTTSTTTATATTPTNLIQNLETLYNILIEYLPKPNEAQEVVDSGQGQQQQDQEAKFNFSYVECLMYSFHMIARFHPEFLVADENKERLRDFRIRLQYFAKGTQNYIKELRNSLSNLSVTAKENEENKIRRVALKVTTNIDVLIKDLFHNPPSYKSAINLSWKSTEQKPATDSASNVSTSGGGGVGTAATKRSLSVSSVDNNDHDGIRKKPERGIYHPPSGKYSTTSNGSASNGVKNNNNNNSNNNNNNNNSKRRTFSNGTNQRGFGGSQRGRF